MAHLTKICDPAVLGAELAVIQERYNGVRLHAGIGYVTPNHEHAGRGPAIRKARQAGLEQARLQRIAYAGRGVECVGRTDHDPTQEALLRQIYRLKSRRMLAAVDALPR